MTSVKAQKKEKKVKQPVVAPNPADLVTLQRPPRVWLPLPRSSQDVVLSTIRIMSYNILAQALVRRELFPYCGKNCLKWTFRSDSLLSEIIEQDPDVLCLQECDNFEGFWQPKLFAAGYEHVYQRRPGKKEDGCAIFYKANKFTLESSTSVNYDDTEQNECFMTHNVGHAAKLRTITGETFIVANTHLYWQPAFSYLRLRQMHQLMKIIWDLQHTQNDLVVLCGDLNTSPACAIYQMFVRGCLDDHNRTSQLLNVCGLKTELVDEDANKLADEILHEDANKLVDDLLHGSFELAKHPFMSAYAEYINLDSRHERHPEYAPECHEPPFTNFCLWKGTLDYILASTRPTTSGHRWRVKNVLSIPSAEELSVQTAIPNDAFGSDHIAIAAELEIIASL